MGILKFLNGEKLTFVVICCILFDKIVMISKSRKSDGEQEHDLGPFVCTTLKHPLHFSVS